MAPGAYTVSRINDLEGLYNGLFKQAPATLGAIDPLINGPGT